MTAEIELPDGDVLARPSAATPDELLAIVHACDVATIGHPDFSLEDVHEWLDSPTTSPDRDGWIVRDGTGRLVAWAYIESPSGGRIEHGIVYVWPGSDFARFGPLVDLVIRRSAARAAESGRPDSELNFWTTVAEHDAERELAATGCTHVRTFARMQRDLDGTEGQVPPPAGVRVQIGVDPTDEAEMRIFHRLCMSTFAGHFGIDADTPYEIWRDHLSVAATTPYDEWLLCYRDGEPVGMMKATDASEDNSGWVQQLGVLAEHRGLGLGRLLLDQAFAGFWRKGYRIAQLGVDLANSSQAYRLYESAGMTLQHEHHAWQLVVPAATAPT